MFDGIELFCCYLRDWKTNIESTDAEIQNEINKFQSLCNLNSRNFTTRFVFFALKIELIRPSKLKDWIEDSMKTFYCLLRPWNKNIRKNTFHIHSVVQIYHKMSYSQIWLKCAKKSTKLGKFWWIIELLFVFSTSEMGFVQLITDNKDLKVLFFQFWRNFNNLSQIYWDLSTAKWQQNTFF